MRLIGAFMLLVCLGMPAIAAEPPVAEEIPWYRRVFLGERSKPVPPAPVTAAKPNLPPSRESIARTFEQEKEVYLQRLAAISKLRQLADERGDDAMMKKADQLETNAQELFDQRTAALKGDSMAADRASLEKKPETERPATAERPAVRRRPFAGGN